MKNNKFFFVQTKENKWERSIPYLKNLEDSKKIIKYLNRFLLFFTIFYFIFYDLLTFNIVPYKRNKKMLNLISINFQYTIYNLKSFSNC